MIKDLVSIIIPCYNGEKYVDRCMQSIISQTYKKLEVIIVNDGSMDSSEQKIRMWNDKLEKQGYIVKYHFQNNQGLGSAINSGLKYVTGEYLTLLDIDDLYMPSSIEKRARYLKINSEFGMVRTNGWFVKDNPDFQQIGMFVYEESEKKSTDIFVDLLLGRTNNWAGTYMLRTELLFKWYPERNIYCSRYGQNLQLILPIAYANKSGFIDEPLMMYVRHEDSSTVGKTGSEEEQIRYLCKNQRGYLDIKKKMIEMIIQDPNKRLIYFRLIKISYYRQLMVVAAWFKNKNFMKSAYTKLKRECSPMIDDKISYYKVILPCFAPFLKIIRKWMCLFRKNKGDARYEKVVNICDYTSL